MVNTRPLLASDRGATQMASDAQYMDFLHKANQAPGVGVAGAAAAATAPAATMDAGETAPAEITRLGSQQRVYASESDEPFEPVCLRWADEAGSGLPDEDEFSTLIRHPGPAAAVEILGPADWDRAGDYADVVRAVTLAAEGNDVRVYRVPGAGARVEYWVVGRRGDGPDARIVGVRAKAVES